MIVTPLSHIQTFRIDGAKALDPITVFVEGIGPGSGRITLVCYGQAWNAGWGSSGDKGVKAFFLSCDDDYLSNCFVRHGRQMSQKAMKREQDYLLRIVAAAKQALAMVSA